MNDYRYILEKGSRKFRCPNCRKKTFVRYIDTETGGYLSEQYGRCDREINCGYHSGPKDYFQNENLSRPAFQNLKKLEICKLIKPQTESALSCIPHDVFQQSRTAYDRNNFVQYLLTVFDTDTVTDLIAGYHIGTSKHWPGSTVFWQIDRQGRIRTGKIMHYSASTGKRTKEPYNHIAWAHKALKTPDFALKQCLFGSHLLIADKKPVAIVESEKTAVIASVYLPSFIWLATGGLSNLNAGQFKELSGRRVVLFPDLGAFGKWSEKVKNFPGVTVSDFLEKNASDHDHDKGLDLADYLVRMPVKDFNRHNNTRARRRIYLHYKKEPEGWHYNVWTRYDGVEVKTLINDKVGYPAEWDESKDAKETAALLINRNPLVLTMMGKLNLTA